MDRLSGIYVIKNIITGDDYIGSSIDMYSRTQRHFNDLKRHSHCNSRLQKSYNEYGESAFVWGIVEKVSNPDDLYSREQLWIDCVFPSLNVRKKTISSRYYDYKHSEESKKLMSEAQKRTWTPEKRQAFSEKKKGTPAHNKGKHFSAETCDKISNSNGARKNFSPIILIDKNNIAHKVTNLSRFCRENNLDRRKIRWLMEGKVSKRYYYDGWKVLRKSDATH